MVRRIVEPQRLGKPRCLGQLRAQLVSYHVEVRRLGVEAAAQQGFQKPPVPRPCEWKPIGAATQDRVGPAAMAIGDEANRAEVGGSERGEVIRVRESLDSCS